jgi:hypothetical protein
MKTDYSKYELAQQWFKKHDIESQIQVYDSTQELTCLSISVHGLTIEVSECEIGYRAQLQIEELNEGGIYLI